VPSPIIARADALMHRKRQNSSELNDVPILSDAIIDDDDIPLLTDIDAAVEPELQDAAVIEAEASAHEIDESEQPETIVAPPIIDPALRDQLVHELASRIEERLRTALPQIISSTVDDFLAEQEIIANS